MEQFKCYNNMISSNVTIPEVASGYCDYVPSGRPPSSGVNIADLRGFSVLVTEGTGHRLPS